MSSFVFPAEPQPVLPINGHDKVFPVHRIFCVGRNYVAHAKEMGNQVDREAPFYFTKSSYALAPSGTSIAYPPGTKDLHHEVELVVAIGAEGFRLPEENAGDLIYGYAVGLDMTRRDLQAAAKEKRRPWDTGKDFEGSAVIGAITQKGDIDDLHGKQIALKVNGALRQEAFLRDMVWPVASLIAHLSGLYHLRAGDLIMTGTPAGVGAVDPGDHLEGKIEGLTPVSLRLSESQEVADPSTVIR